MKNVYTDPVVTVTNFEYVKGLPYVSGADVNNNQEGGEWGEE